MSRTSPGPGILRDPVHFVAMGFGSGLVPFAPGTAGTLVAVLLELWVRQWLPDVLQRAILVIAMIIFGIWVCHVSARKLGRHDHQAIVLDEICGYFVTMLAAPAGWLWIVVGFSLFRVLDIVKPWPIREVDHSIGGGLGIMLDDIVAGLLSAAAILAARGLLT
ncbi:MAG: phosphatidylglycerophosphatase A [Gammaproteobacteria bacterium]|nr:phosphatidylglycerophosphatase A [Gammaproteobacteria bacterium]